MPERTLTPEGVLFEEVQPMAGPIRAIGLIGALALIPVVAYMWAEPRRPPLSGILGTGLSILALAAVGIGRLVTRVSTRQAVATFHPFPFSTIRLRPADIAEVRLYEFGIFGMPGGIGFHLGPGWRSATAHSGTGVLVTRRDGVRCLIGTQRPDALAAALRQLASQATR